jgi:hypothetical protein
MGGSVVKKSGAAELGPFEPAFSENWVVAGQNGAGAAAEGVDSYLMTARRSFRLRISVSACWMLNFDLSTAYRSRIEP